MTSVRDRAGERTTPIAAVNPGSVRLATVSGVVLLGGAVLLLIAGLLYASGSQWKPAVLAAGLLVTLFGLIAFEEELRDRGERLLPRFGSAAFAIGATCFIVDDAIAQNSGHFVFELERVYTVLACVSIGLFGWSILRTKALSPAIGWFAMTWGLAFGVLYVARILTPPLGPNLATLVFGIALIRRNVTSGARPILTP